MPSQAFVIIRPPPGPLAKQLRESTPRTRRELATAIIREGLPRLLREGLPPGGVPDAIGEEPMRISLSLADYFDLRDAADKLKSNRSSLMRELIFSRQTEESREGLEHEYIRLGHPGDPRRLSRSVLLLMLKKQGVTPLERALMDLALQNERLQCRIDNLEKKVDIYVARPSAAELQAMTFEELKDYLRRIGGKIPAYATREKLLGAIYKIEVDF